VQDLLLLPALALLLLLLLLLLGLLVLHRVDGFWLLEAASRKACGLRRCQLAHQRQYQHRHLMARLARL
jgi:hypothetical protein